MAKQQGPSGKILLERGRKQGFIEGKEEGFTQGRQVGFDEGHKHLVSLVEEILSKELRLASREELLKSGKLPALWIITLLRYQTEQRKLVPEVKTTTVPTREQLEQIEEKEGDTNV